MTRIGLRTRAIGGMAALALAASLIVGLLVTGPASTMAIHRAAELFGILPDDVLAQCHADPDHWTWRNDQGIQVWALDTERATPRSALAPALPPGLPVRLRLGEREPVVFGLNGGAMVVRQGPPGPCEALVVFWPPNPDIQDVLGVRVVAVVGLTVLGAMAGCWWLIVRPLVRSIQRLDQTARTVGQAGYTGAVAVDPAMEAVAAALDDAHSRVLAEHEQLAGIGLALERHLADVAHDLRTPLAALQLRLERLSSDPADDQALRGALQDVTTLAMLTENLALASQLRSGSLVVSAGRGPVDLRSVVLRVAERFAVLGSRVGIEVVHGVPDAAVPVTGDALLMEQLLANLVHNAVGHNEAGGHVAITLGATAAAFELVVEDDGPGVPPELLADITRRGVVQGETPGQGLGLNIVAQIADHLGWTVVLRRADPSGLLVVVTGRSEN
ncbi:MAG: HAMP domain-containing sensor histidine kinase [Myxococcota bacterium]